MCASSGWAINYSVPYVRNGLPDWLQGYGATIGLLEVQGDEGNGIDAFSGHQHIALSNFVSVVDFADGDPSDEYFHGTFVAGVMASQFTTFTGMAPFSTYYGSIFSGADTKIAYVGLVNAMQHLVVTNGAQAINHSWGSSPTNAVELDGMSATALLMDEYAGYFGKTGGVTQAYMDRLMVFAAGNDGDTTGLLGSPADSYNGLSVGALDVTDPAAFAWDNPARAPTNVIAAYSSWRPMADGRAGVHVVAPGTYIWSTLSIDYFTNSALVAGTANGTSFAAPHVTGEAALLYGEQTDYLVSNKGTLLQDDHKLMKAIIINSARKIAGLDSNGVAQAVWTPGAVSVNGGVTNAVIPLNYAVGAGEADAYAASLTYLEIGNHFWALDLLHEAGATNFYTMGTDKFTNDTPTAPTFDLTATLTWDRLVDFVPDVDTNNPSAGTVESSALSNLDLLLQQEITPGVWVDVYQSAGNVMNVEHLFLPNLAATNTYRLAVTATTFEADPLAGEQYALAVSFAAIPEPSVMGLILVAAAGFRFARKRRQLRRPGGRI